MEIDVTGAIVEVTSYMMRMAGWPTEPKARSMEAAKLFVELREQEVDHVTVLFLASLMMQVGTIQMLADRVKVPGLDTEALVTMMAQQALANDVG